MDLVTVTCNRDFQHMLLQAESIQKFLEPCTHWIVINEYEDLDVDRWHDALSKFYINHKYNILTPNDFGISMLPLPGWHTQQYFKLAISTFTNEDYIIMDTKGFFIKPTTLNYWKNTMGSGVLHKFRESIETPSWEDNWEDISTYYATKFNTTALTYFLFSPPFKIDIDIIKTYDMKNLLSDLYPTKEEAKSYFELTGKHRYPSEFILYSYLARDYFDRHVPVKNSFLNISPKHLSGKNETQILQEILQKMVSADANNNITSFSIHPLIFDRVTDNHINYINKWLTKKGFNFQFNPKILTLGL